MNVTAPSAETLPDAPTSAIIRWLDRTIIVLMVAILLTLSWPVSVALWGARQPVSSAPTLRYVSDGGHDSTSWASPARSAATTTGTQPRYDDF